MTNVSLALAVMTWKKINTLKNTLQSYKDNGLLDKCDQLMLWCNEREPIHDIIGKDFGFEVYGSHRNLGAGYPFARLCELCKCDYILFLEHDFVLIESKEVMEKEINLGIELLKDGFVNTVRYRHLKQPGDPLCCKDMKNCEWVYMPLIFEGVYLRDDPLILKEIKQHESGAFYTSYEFSMYTNNPVMYKTDWFYNNIVLLIPSSEGKLYDGFELNMIPLWKKIQPNISHVPIGLFSHIDLGN